MNLDLVSTWVFRWEINCSADTKKQDGKTVFRVMYLLNIVQLSFTCSKLNNGKTRTVREIYSKLAIKTGE